MVMVGISSARMNLDLSSQWWALSLLTFEFKHPRVFRVLAIYMQKRVTGDLFHVASDDVSWHVDMCRLWIGAHA